MEKEICPYCGTLVPRSIKYCLNCGRNLEGVFEKYDSEESSGRTAVKKKVSPKTIVIPITAVLVILLLGLSVGYIMKRKNVPNTNDIKDTDYAGNITDTILEPERKVVKAIETRNLEKMYILTEDTGLIEISKPQADKAWITADRKHVVLHKNQDLYYVNTMDIVNNVIDSDTPKEKMNSNGDLSLETDFVIRDTGVVMYEYSDGHMYINRYFWDDGEYVVYENENVSVYSKLTGADSLNTLFIIESGVYILPEHSDQMYLVGSLPEAIADDEVQLFSVMEALFVNNDGTYVMWSYETEEGAYVVTYKNGGIQTTETGNIRLTSDNYTNIWSMSKDGFLFVFKNDNKFVYRYGDSDYITLYEEDADAVSGEHSGRGMKYCCYYANGRSLDRCVESELDDLCITVTDTEANDRCKLIKTVLGESGEVLQSGNQFEISGRHVIWEDSTGHIWISDYDGTLTNTEEVKAWDDIKYIGLYKIESGFAMINVATIDDAREQYICKISTGEVQKLDTELSIVREWEQADSDKLFFITGMDRSHLYLYDFKTNNLELISKEVSDSDLISCAGCSDTVIYTGHMSEDDDYVDRLWMYTDGNNKFLSVYYTDDYFTSLICDYLNTTMYSKYGFQYIKNINVTEDEVYAGGPYIYSDIREGWLTVGFRMTENMWKIDFHNFEDDM